VISLRLPTAGEGDEFAASRLTHPSGPPSADLSRLPPGVSALLPGVRWMPDRCRVELSVPLPLHGGDGGHLTNRSTRMMPSVLQERPPDCAWGSSRVC
jgi:hypothetical protein